MWEVYDGASNGMNYENKMLLLYKECETEIYKNAHNKTKEDIVPYLKTILPQFYINEPNKAKDSFLSIQENFVQNAISEYAKGENEPDYTFSPEQNPITTLQDFDFITINVQGFDYELFKHHSYYSLNEQEDTYYDNIPEDTMKLLNERKSFVKTILSIKKRTKEKLELQINNWIELEQSPINISVSDEPKISIMERLKGKPKTFNEIFVAKEWNKYLDLLTKCEPPLLIKEEKQYKFIGNQKTQRGCVAQYFKFLKIKGIISQSIDRDELAKVLSSEIINFSINGSTIDNESTNYKKTFQQQLEVTL